MVIVIDAARLFIGFNHKMVKFLPDDVEHVSLGFDDSHNRKLLVCHFFILLCVRQESALDPE
jgi:hypothetical protein